MVSVIVSISRPLICEAATFAISYPGATNPYIICWYKATSPIAYIQLSEVFIVLSTTIPPLVPVTKPHSLANSSLGLIPADMISISVFRTSPSINLRPSILFSPVIYSVCLLRYTLIPKDSIFCCNILLPP